MTFTLGEVDVPGIPGGRVGAATWLDQNGILWLFGGAAPGKRGSPPGMHIIKNHYEINKQK